MKSLRKSGFTLLELLVVISIIAILAVSLTPAFSRAREAARRTTCGQNMGQIHKAITMYEIDFATYPASGTSSAIYTTGGLKGQQLLYRQYIDDARVFSCPSKVLAPSDIASITPSTATTYTMKSSYGYSPGHDSKNSRVIILADAKGSAGNNSDNHGKNTGQNILSAGGSVSFLSNTGSAPVNELGLADDGTTKIIDSNIFAPTTITAGYEEWDSNCMNTD